MADREKVLSGLEHCRRGPIGCQQECPYKSDFGCRSQLTADALELLKEQEPKSAIIEGTDTAHVGRCPSCHVILTPFRANYCYCCGKAVKWDDN